MTEVYFPDGTMLGDLITNRNVVASNPAASRGEGEIIYNSTNNEVYKNTGTAISPIWSAIGSGGISNPMTTDLDMDNYNIIGVDKIIADAATNLTFQVTAGQSFVFQKV